MVFYSLLRYESWDDPDVPKFHYGSHYSSAGIVLFYLLRLPPFSIENQKLQGGQFDHADRLFNSVRDTWLSAAGKSNTSDVKELIPEFFYMPEYLENRFSLDLGEKQSGEKVTYKNHAFFAAIWCFYICIFLEHVPFSYIALINSDFHVYPLYVLFLINPL